MSKILIDEATVKLALEKIKAARDCHPNAVDTLLFEAEEILEEALAEQPAQQEPVAYWIPKAEQFCIADPSGRPFAKAWEPLYTTPQPAQRTWVGLMDDEKHEAVSDEIGRIRDYGDYADAIEAKLKEKNA